MGWWGGGGIRGGVERDWMRVPSLRAGNVTWAGQMPVLDCGGCTELELGRRKACGVLVRMLDGTMCVELYRGRNSE